MNNLLDNKMFLSSVLFLAAALIFGGSLVWYGVQARQTGSGPAIGAPSAPPTDPYHGAANPQLVASLKQAHTPIVGVVSSVGSGQLTLKQTNVSQDVTFAVDSHTELYKRGGQNPDYQKEFQAFLQATQHLDSASIKAYVPPDQLLHSPISLSDIKVGENVLVIPADDSQAATRPAQTVVTGEIGF